MRGIPTLSTDCSSAEPSPIFPYRPRSKATKRSLGLHGKRHVRELWSLIARLSSLGAIAPVIMAIAPFMCMIGTSTLLKSSACAQTVSRPQSIDRLAKFIVEASVRFAVPAHWIRAVIRVESGGNEHAISPRGAMGLMQLMPATWVELSARHGLGLDPFDASDNISAGTAYLKEMYGRFGSAGFLAAYHAGPGRYEQHLATGQPLPPETIAYVTAITSLLTEEQGERTDSRNRRALSWREAPLFVERVDAP